MNAMSRVLADMALATLALLVVSVPARGGEAVVDSRRFSWAETRFVAVLRSPTPLRGRVELDSWNDHRGIRVAGRLSYSASDR